MDTFKRLLVSIKDGRLEEDIQQLVQAGESLDAKDKYGYTVLYYAVDGGYMSIIKYLVQYGASLDVMEHSGCTLLHYAAENGHLSVVEYLIQNGVLVNSKDNYGWSALHYSAEYGHLFIVKVLLENGADYTICNDNEETAKDLAEKEENYIIVDLLQEWEDTVNEVKEPGYD